MVQGVDPRPHRSELLQSVGGRRCVAAGRRLQVLDLLLVEQFDLLAIVGHLVFVLGAQLLQRVLELSLVFLRQVAVDLAEFDLAAGAGFGQLLLVDLAENEEKVSLNNHGHVLFLKLTINQMKYSAGHVGTQIKGLFKFFLSIWLFVYLSIANKEISKQTKLSFPYD